MSRGYSISVSREASLRLFARLRPLALAAHRSRTGKLTLILRKAAEEILIDKHGRVIAGNKTVENAGLIGLEDLVVVDTDGKKLVAVRRTDLDLETDPRARELALFDNRTAEVNLDWDADIIAAFDTDGIDLSPMFTDAEIPALVGATEESAAPEEFTSVGDEIATEFQ